MRFNISTAQGTIEEFFRKKFSKKPIAQGTIEYLIVIAVIVVIGLVVVSLLASTTDTQNLATTTGRIDTQTRSGIVITEAAADITGDSLLLIRNNDPEEKTLTKITIDGKENVFAQKIQRVQEILIKLEQLETNCKCEAEQTTKTCTYQIEYTSRYGITTTQTQTTTITCEQNITPATNPSIPTYIFSTNNCFDITQDPIPICTLNDLNRIRENLTTSYKLVNDIDASDTVNWNSEKGWVPIGTFSGNFDGQGFKIKNLFMNYDDVSAGLFSGISNATIKNIGLSNVDINGYDLVGALAASSSNSIVKNSFVTGTITGTYPIGIGGFFGTAFNTDINESYTDISINAYEMYLGGLIGSSTNSNINNSYTKGEINGDILLGGLIGEGTGTITNSYSSINITDSGGGPSGGLVSTNGSLLHSIHIKNSFTAGNYFGIVAGIIYNESVNTTLTNTYTINSNCGFEIGCTPNQNLSSLYLSNHPVYTNPVSEWDFDNIWQENANALPTLKVFN